LWVRGAARLDEACGAAVGMVGARAATSYGAWAGSDFAHGLAGRGWTVVSGGGHGIDAACHRGALAAGGVTMVVAAGGLARPYPAGNAGLFAGSPTRGCWSVSGRRTHYPSGAGSCSGPG
jgi:DNA processing protein